MSTHKSNSSNESEPNTIECAMFFDDVGPTYRWRTLTKNEDYTIEPDIENTRHQLGGSNQSTRLLISLFQLGRYSVEVANVVKQ
jgi:hypothetical protein